MDDLDLILCCELEKNLKMIKINCLYLSAKKYLKGVVDNAERKKRNGVWGQCGLESARASFGI